MSAFLLTVEAKAKVKELHRLMFLEWQTRKTHIEGQGAQQAYKAALALSPLKQGDKVTCQEHVCVITHVEIDCAGFTVESPEDRKKCYRFFYQAAKQRRVNGKRSKGRYVLTGLTLDDFSVASR